MRNSTLLDITFINGYRMRAFHLSVQLTGCEWMFFPLMCSLCVWHDNSRTTKALGG